MEWWEAVLLLAGGMTAGVINTMAGGGSALTVPLLVLAGVPGNVANGPNRIGILTSNIAATAKFRKLGVDGLRDAAVAVVPAIVGSVIGAYGITRFADDDFERLFGLLMIPIVLLTIFRPQTKAADSPWPPVALGGAFLLVGIYGGAVQAGVGLIMVAVLNAAGFDLVKSNAIKVAVNVGITLAALPVFIAQDKVRWIAGLILAVGLTAGGWLGAHFAVKGGEKWIRLVMVLAALALAGRLLGLWG